MRVISGVLTPDEAAAMLQVATGLTYEDGAKTAGRFSRGVKANDQAAYSPERQALFDKVRAALARNALFQSAARPRLLSPLILSRYRVGQTYGLHVDNAFMEGLRTDLSFTLFLAPPDSYQGGALVVQDAYQDRAVKLAAGDMVLYSSGTLHRVEAVTSGARVAVVGWVQSLVRDHGQREILFDMDQAIETVHAEAGKSALFDSLSKTRANLIRMWAET
jgi:PKHD-type hydroxylase